MSFGKLTASQFLKCFLKFLKPLDRNAGLYIELLLSIPILTAFMQVYNKTLCKVEL